MAVVADIIKVESSRFAESSLFQAGTGVKNRATKGITTSKKAGTLPPLFHFFFARYSPRRCLKQAKKETTTTQAIKRLSNIGRAAMLLKRHDKSFTNL